MLGNPLSLVPDEVRQMVVSHLSIRDLLSLLQVNSACHRVATAALRRIQTVDLVSDTGTSPCSLNPCLNDVEYAQQVRCITVKPHKYASCRKVVLPHLPRLNMIRLHLGPDSMYDMERLLHDDDTLPREKTEREWPQRNLSDVTCPFLGFEGVETVVIVDTSDLQGPSITEILPVETLKNIKTSVLFLSSAQTGTGTAVNNELEQGDAEHPTRMDLIVSFATPWTDSLTVVYQYPQRIPFYTLAFDDEHVESFEKAIQCPPGELIQGIFDLCDDIGCNPEVLKAVPKLKIFTIVVPDGVLTSKTCRFFAAQIKSNLERYGKKKMPTVRILSMSEFMKHEDYTGVMTEEEKKLWEKRSHLPHYTMTKQEIKQCIYLSRQEKAAKSAMLKDMDGDCVIM